MVKIEKVEIKRKNNVLEGSVNEKIKSLIQIMKENGINNVYSGQK